MIAVCTTCDRVEVMTTCPCGGVVVQLPGWVRAYDGYYTLLDASPPIAVIAWTSSVTAVTPSVSKSP